MKCLSENWNHNNSVCGRVNKNKNWNEYIYFTSEECFLIFFTFMCNLCAVTMKLLRKCIKSIFLASIHKLHCA